MLQYILPQELVDHITQNIMPPGRRAGQDKPCWMLETKGEGFTFKSEWQYIRHKEVPIRSINGFGRRGYLLKWPL